MPGVQTQLEKARSRQAVEALESLADDAIRWVADEIYLRNATVLSLRGAKGRLHTQQDLKYHLEFLSGALATDTSAFFTDYVCWLATVLETRGVPVTLLDISLELLKSYFEKSLDPQHSAGVANVLEQGRRALGEAGNSRRALYGDYRPADLPHVGAMTLSLVNGDVQKARSLMQASWQSSGNYVEIATRLFQPALYDIGGLWERNEITVAQEHLATAISQTLLTELFLTAGIFARPSERTAVFSGIEGNQHTLGLRMVSDAFELAGWSVLYLGADTPTDALLAMLDSTSPELVGLSVSMVQHLPPLQRTVHAIKAELGSRSPYILIGGLPTNQWDEIWKWVGADAWSPDAGKAIMQIA